MACVLAYMYMYVHAMSPIALCAPPLIFQIPSLAPKVWGIFVGLSCIHVELDARLLCVRSTAQPARDDDACGFPDMLSVTKRQRMQHSMGSAIARVCFVFV